MTCPVCEGREAGLFESLCEQHFNDLVPISEEKIRAAMEEGRKAAEAYRNSMRYRRGPR